MDMPSGAAVGGAGATVLALVGFLARNWIIDWIQEKRESRLARQQERLTELQGKQREKEAFLAESRSYREDIKTLMTNHIAHLHSTQEAFQAFQINMVKTSEGLLRAQNEIVEALKGLDKKMDLVSEDIGLVRKKLKTIEEEVQ